VSADLVPGGTDVPTGLDAQLRLADALAQADLLPAHLRRRPANVLVILQGARALHVPAFWALQSMHVVEGKLSLSAELMRALVIRAGHSVRVVERSATRAVVEVQRHDRARPYRAEFTMTDAVAADLADKVNWRRYPASMLVARATAIAVRDECPDVLYGVVYTADELGAVTDDAGTPVLDGELVDDDPPPAPAAAGGGRPTPVMAVITMAGRAGLSGDALDADVHERYGLGLAECTDGQLRALWYRYQQLAREGTAAPDPGPAPEPEPVSEPTPGPAPSAPHEPVHR
jgi:hypothetical protein